MSKFMELIFSSIWVYTGFLLMIALIGNLIIDIIREIKK